MVNYKQTDIVNGCTIDSGRATGTGRSALRFGGVLKKLLCPGANQAMERGGNRLLGAMEAASLARIAPHLEPVVLKHAYFPQGAVLSLLTVLKNGSALSQKVIRTSNGACCCTTLIRRFGSVNAALKLAGFKVRVSWRPILSGTGVLDADRAEICKVPVYSEPA